MVDWLEKFVQERASKSMKKTASQVIVDRNEFPNATEEDIVNYKNEQYKVINSSYADAEGDGILLEKCAELVGTPTEVAMGTSPDYANPISGGNTKAQEYANTNPQIQDPDPRDEEVAKFEEEARETEQAISAEDAIDGTSAATRPNRILQKIVDNYAPAVPTDVAPVEAPIDTPVEEVAPVDDDTVDLETYDFDDEVEDFTDETPIEEEPVEDIPVDEEVEDDDLDIADLSDEFDKLSNRIAKRLRG